MDDTQLNSELRLCWLVYQPYNKVKAFWDVMANISKRTTRTGSRPSIIRVWHPTYRKMKKAGWMNIAKLEDTDIPEDARSILDMVRAHATSTGINKHASLQMVLNPYVYNDGYDYLRVKWQAVPACVPYLVLEEFNVIFNHLAVGKNYFTQAHITFLTEESLRWMNYRHMAPPSANGSVPRTIFWNNPWVNNLNSASTNSVPLLDPEAVCVICIERIVAAEQSYVILECLHAFHADCIRKWKRKKKFESTCPTCRADIVTVVHRNSV